MVASDSRVMASLPETSLPEVLRTAQRRFPPQVPFLLFMLASGLGGDPSVCQDRPCP